MSGPKSSPTLPRAAVDEAAQWFLALQQETENGQTFIDWQRWMSSAPEHKLAYEQIEDAALRMRLVPDHSVKLPSSLELARDHYDGSQSIHEWKTVARRSRPLLQYALAASLVGAIALGAWFAVDNWRDPQTGTHSYQTAAAEKQTIRLPDGSKVTLDADSALEVQFAATHRTLRLRRGEAFFEVARDPNRPFKVSAGPTQVTALGTSFNVRLSDNRTIVAVVEGKVEVTAAPQLSGAGEQNPIESREPGESATVRLAAQLSAGEAVSYSDTGNLHALPGAEATLATGWLEGRRQYRNEPLRYVLADVDRYTGQRINITDEAAGELKFTGTINLQNSAAWLQGLSVAMPVSVTQQPDGTLSVEMSPR